MMIRKKRKEAVSPVIAVILMVAITVVLAGVLYVWVTSLADPDEDVVKTYVLTVKDAPHDKLNKSVTFEIGEDLVVIEHGGGDPIDWNGHDVMLEVRNTSERIKLDPSSVAGAPYHPVNNSQTEVGEFIIFKATTDDFSSGDWVKLVIVYGSQLRYKSPGYFILY